MADYSRLPQGVNSTSFQPFRAHIPDAKLTHMLDLLKLSPIGPAVWENSSHEQGETLMSTPSRKHGMRRDWLIDAKDHWLNEFDWRKQEDYINSFPQYMTKIKDDEGFEYDVHFMALFSKREDAVPIGFYHGWPGSFLEFLKLFQLLKDQYTPDTLPYHVIAPSLVGYAFTSGPDVSSDYTVQQCAEVMHKLMLSLGFGKTGYLSQGGDIGSFIARVQANTYAECKGVHLNMFLIVDPSGLEAKDIDPIEEKAMQRSGEFVSDGRAYSMMHGQRGGTIGLALSASPLAMLSWIGEKFLEWTDVDPPIDEILASVSLYWLTDCYARCIYSYRGKASGDAFARIRKPTGYSLFPKEIHAAPKSWAETQCDLVHFERHERGGHFAALENPAILLKDVEAWVPKAWKGPKL